MSRNSLTQPRSQVTKPTKPTPTLPPTSTSALAPAAPALRPSSGSSSSSSVSVSNSSLDSFWDLSGDNQKKEIKEWKTKRMTANEAKMIALSEAVTIMGNMIPSMIGIVMDTCKICHSAILDIAIALHKNKMFPGKFMLAVVVSKKAIGALERIKKEKEQQLITSLDNMSSLSSSSSSSFSAASASMYETESICLTLEAAQDELTQMLDKAYKIRAEELKTSKEAKKQEGGKLNKGVKEANVKGRQSLNEPLNDNANDHKLPELPEYNQLRLALVTHVTLFQPPTAVKMDDKGGVSFEFAFPAGKFMQQAVTIKNIDSTPVFLIPANEEMYASILPACKGMVDGGDSEWQNLHNHKLDFISPQSYVYVKLIMDINEIAAENTARSQQGADLPSVPRRDTDFHLHVCQLIENFQYSPLQKKLLLHTANFLLRNHLLVTHENPNMQKVALDINELNGVGAKGDNSLLRIMCNDSKPQSTVTLVDGKTLIIDFYRKTLNKLIENLSSHFIIRTVNKPKAGLAGEKKKDESDESDESAEIECLFNKIPCNPHDFSDKYENCRDLVLIGLAEQDYEARQQALKQGLVRKVSVATKAADVR